MSTYPPSIKRLIDRFAELPGIGPKTAERLVFYLLENGLERFGEDLNAARGKFNRCQTCANVSDQDSCPICSNKQRDASLIAVVEKPQDVEVLERSGEFNGRYFVLGGLLAPLEGKTAQDLKIDELKQRLMNSDQRIHEIILAFDSNIEGESTAIYLAKLLKPLNVKVTRLARGLPVGSDLEYADDVTLKDAIKHRWEI